ncbi:MAG: SHD1 domain-containing protein [Planctomycetaceae bacterium]|nr:SHD1 domain-containing protein [Planctomycetaceae bacterium]
MANLISLKKHVVWCFTVLLVLLWNGALNAQQMRTWTDSTRQFTVEAKMVEFDGENVKLEKADGLTVTLAISKLSLADQRYARQQQTANPFAGGEPAGATSDNRPANGGTGSQSGTARSGNVNGVEKIVVGVVSGWNYKPEPVPWDGEKANYQPCPISGDSGVGYFQMLDIVKGTDAAIAVATYDNHNTNSTFACMMNMNAGKTIAHDMKHKAKIWGLSPDGKRVMATPNDFQDKVGKSRLDFYGITDKGLTRTSSLIPYADGKNDYNRYIEWAAWVSPTHILTCNNDHTLRLWDMKTGKAIYQTALGAKNVVLSPDRKVMVVPSQSGVFLCDTMTGKTLGKLSGDPSTSIEFDFSPDQTRLLGVMHKLPKSLSSGDITDELRNKVVHIWDLTTGQKLNEWVFNSEPTVARWVDNRMIMKSNTLYDSKTGVPVCHYDGGYVTTTTFNGLFCYLLIVRTNEYVLASAKLPHKAAVDVADKGNVNERFVLYPGAEVSIKVETDGSADENEIRKFLERNLSDCGFVVTNSAKTQFTASVRKSAEGEETYRGDSGMFPRPPLPRPPFSMSPLFDRGGPQVDVKITVHESILTISSNGKEFWKMGVSAYPESIPLDKDRSIQEIADELCKPDLEFFARTQLPRYHTGEVPQRVPFAIVRQGIPENNSALINATLTPTGVR